MRAVPGLAFRLLRGSGGGAMLSAGLSALAVALVVALLLLTLGVNHGFSERAEREAWLDPVAARGDASAVMAVSTDFVRGRPLAVVDAAGLGRDKVAPPPPGMGRFPRPGEVWMSPALAELARELPRDQLADRFQKTPSGILGEEALTHPDQLMVVVGRDRGDPALGDARPEQVSFVPYSDPPTRVADFSGRYPLWYEFYRPLAAFATALVVVPLVVLGAAAGRLATVQRDRRLSAMRLFGATPGQVLAITTVETVLAAAVGTGLGAIAYAMSLPLASQVEASGGTWFVSDLWVETDVLAATLVAAPLVVGASALFGMRRLVVSPLGVARRQRSFGTKVWRLALFVALIAGYVLVAPQANRSTAVAIAAAFGVVFLALAVLGPFVVMLLGRVLTLLARGPETLLAGRRLVDDPRSAWRTVSGIILAGFVAGFLTVMIPAEIPATTGELRVLVPPSDAPALADEARGALRDAGMEGSVSISKDVFLASGPATSALTVRVRGGEEEVDRARTALTTISPWQPPVSSEAESWEMEAQSRDVATASLLVLAVTLAVASASAAITGVTGILDRRKTYGLLKLAGTPLSVLDGARIRETLIPLALFGGGSVAAGMVCALPLLVPAGIGFSLRALPGLGVVALFAVLGVALAELAGCLSLRIATRQATIHRE